MMEISGIISGLFPPNHRLPLTPKSSQGLGTGLLWLKRLSQSVFGQWLSLDPRQDGVTARDTGWSLRVILAPQLKHFILEATLSLSLE